MKRAVSVSLGQPSRDKRVIVTFKGTPIDIERIGTGGDDRKASRLLAELDGTVNVLAVGGIDLYVYLDGRDYPIRTALRMAQDVHTTPLVDGRVLKRTMERRVFELAAPALGDTPHFRRAFVPFGTDRIGMIEAVTTVTDQVVIGDLMFVFGLPLPIYGLDRFRKVARLLLPAVGYLPMSMLLPPGAKGETHTPKFHRFWAEADLIAGDMHYIHKYAPDDLSGKTVITNTTTEENIQLLDSRGVSKVITMSPRYEGRSFGANMIEAVLTAYADKGRPLTETELGVLVDELDLRPSVLELND